MSLVPQNQEAVSEGSDMNKLDKSYRSENEADYENESTKDWSKEDFEWSSAEEESCDFRVVTNKKNK